MKPTIGRTVIFVFPDNEKYLMENNNGARTAPATIVRVFDGMEGPDPGYDTQRVNLKVHTDGMTDLWMTSVQHDQTGKQDTSWHWPVITE